MSQMSLSVLTAETGWYQQVTGRAGRVHVEDNRASFFEGREFRTFVELSIPSLATAVIRATITKDIILYNSGIVIASGDISMRLYAGGTTGGTWTAAPVIRKNTTTVAPVVASGTTMEYGGTYTPGVLIDTIRVVSTGTDNKGSTVGSSPADERGVGPGVYHYTFTNNSNQTATGIFRGFWEELP